MPDDSSLRIAVLGAGPIGLEVTLYARYLGYGVELFERSGAIAANIADWGHVRLFSPFGMNATTLGVAAIAAQDGQWDCPGVEELLTGQQFWERYLRPLSESDLIVDCLRLGTEVVSVGRRGWLKGEGVGDATRSEAGFRLLCRNAGGVEQIHAADIVIDCTGTYGNHNWLGQDGIPAVGEDATASQISYTLPDVLDRDREVYSGKHALVVGAGYSAATTVALLAQLAEEQGGTRVTWITRGQGEEGPIRRIPNDRLLERDALAEAANRLAAEPGGPVLHLAGRSIVAIAYRSGTDNFEVAFAGEEAEPRAFDRVVANVGYRPEDRIYAELQVHACYASGGPMKLAANLLSQANSAAAVDCLDQGSCGPESLMNPEPNFYILGSKSYGRGSQFLMSVGFEQIRDLFTLIGQREDLDLYATMPQLVVE